MTLCFRSKHGDFTAGGIGDRWIAGIGAGIVRRLTNDGARVVGFGGDPADIAGVVAYLASLESLFVTGSTWDVDGGFGA